MQTEQNDTPMPPDFRGFLERASDDELLRFLKRLPVAAGNKGEELSMMDLVFEIRLWPYVVKAWKSVEGSPGIPGRLLQLARVYARAEQALERETGLTRRRPRTIDLDAFMQQYATLGIP